MIQLQEVNGWESFYQGLMIQDWQHVQHTYLKSTKQLTKRRNGDLWGNKVTEALMSYTNNLWKHRNKELHGATPQEEKQRTLDKLHLRVDNLYEEWQKLKHNTTNPVLFGINKEDRKQAGPQALKFWIETATEFIKIEKGKKKDGTNLTQNQRTLDGWVQPGD